MRSEPNFRIVEPHKREALERHRLKVIGIGGCGGNAVRYMREHGLQGVGLVAANTDAQALDKVGDVTKLELGNGATRGMGAGSMPALGEQAARDDKERIVDALQGADMVFIAAGMGGGTGTGAAPVVAEITRELGILTVAVVTRPFEGEGPARMKVADQGIERLGNAVNSLIVVPNARLLDIHGDKRVDDLYREGTAVLYNAVRSIADFIQCPGLVNVDFADVKNVMSVKGGMALMGTGTAEGANRAEKAVNAAIRCPLLEKIDVRNARGVLVNVIGDPIAREYDLISNAVQQMAASDATVVCGLVSDLSMGESLKVTVIVTGIAARPALAASATPAPQTSADMSPPLRPVVNNSNLPASEQDYGPFESPAFLRKQTS